MGCREVLVGGVEFGAEKEQRGDSACGLLEVADLFAHERPAGYGCVAVAQPLPQHLVAADAALPDGF